MDGNKDDIIIFIAVCQQNLQVHVFDLNQDGENTEFMDDDEEDGQSPSSHHWILPSNTFHDLWDSLVFETEVKTRVG